MELVLVSYRKRFGQIADEEAFIQCLGNATEFSINLTNFTDEEMLRLKRAMDENRSVI